MGMIKGIFVTKLNDVWISCEMEIDKESIESKENVESNSFGEMIRDIGEKKWVDNLKTQKDGDQ